MFSVFLVSYDCLIFYHFKIVFDESEPKVRFKILSLPSTNQSVYFHLHVWASDHIAKIRFILTKSLIGKRKEIFDFFSFYRMSWFIEKIEMSNESFQRLLEHSHKMIAKEVENTFVPRNELFYSLPD